MLRRMTDALPQVIAINFARQLVLFEDGCQSSFTAMFDTDGDITNDADEAVSFVAQHQTSGWWVTVLRIDFEPPEIVH